MEGDDDDDEHNTFQSLAAATASALSKIENGHTKDAHENEKSGERDQRDQQAKRAEAEKRNYVARRLRELAAFERRAIGQRFKR